MATDDNSKLGYCYSVALHIFVATAMFAYALIDILFPKEITENKIVFEMVEPSDAPPAPPAPPETAPELKVEKIKDTLAKINDTTANMPYVIRQGHTIGCFDTCTSGVATSQTAESAQDTPRQIFKTIAPILP